MYIGAALKYNFKTFIYVLGCQVCILVHMQECVFVITKPWHMQMLQFMQKAHF